MADALVRESVARRRAVGWGIVALGLVAVVAMEANGAAWSRHRGDEVHSLPHGVVVAGGLGAGAVVIVLVVYGLATARVVETPGQRKKRWTMAIGFIVAIALISIARLLFHAAPVHPRSPVAPAAHARTEVGPNGTNQHNGQTWWPLVIVGLGIAAALTAAVTTRPELPTTTDSGVDEATIAMLDASLDDLRTEPDPRRAVTAAYARTEAGLAARGFARRPSETPTEYLQRALVGTDANDGRGSVTTFAVAPLSELTALAERARFSTLPIDETMRSRAIAALESLRREIFAAADDARMRVE